METLRIAYVDFWPEWNDENFIEPILKEHFNVVIDLDNPDVVFHSVFGGQRGIQRYPKAKKILFLGENRRPGSLSDFSISFDPHTATNFRLPLWQAYILKKPDLADRLLDKRIQFNQENFERFAAFIVSNPSNFFRNSAYQSLSNYKHVSSYGRYLTNDNSLVQYSQGKYWRDAKDDFFIQHPHKFMFAFENTPHPGYCTEKLMDGFLAGTIPIYWGDPHIHLDWNQDSFINAMTNPNWIEEVKRLDGNWHAYEEKYNQPIFTHEQRLKHRENLAGFKEWLIGKIKI